MRVVLKAAYFDIAAAFRRAAFHVLVVCRRVHLLATLFRPGLRSPPARLGVRSAPSAARATKRPRAVANRDHEQRVRAERRARGGRSARPQSRVRVRVRVRVRRGPAARGVLAERIILGRAAISCSWLVRVLDLRHRLLPDQFSLDGDVRDVDRRRCHCQSQPECSSSALELPLWRGESEAAWARARAAVARACIAAAPVSSSAQTAARTVVHRHAFAALALAGCQPAPIRPHLGDALGELVQHDCRHMPGCRALLGSLDHLSSHGRYHVGRRNVRRQRLRDPQPSGAVPRLEVWARAEAAHAVVHHDIYVPAERLHLLLAVRREYDGPRRGMLVAPQAQLRKRRVAGSTPVVDSPSVITLGGSLMCVLRRR